MTVKDISKISLGDDIHIDSVDNMALITTNCYEYRRGMLSEKLLNSEVADIMAVGIGEFSIRIAWQGRNKR